MDRSGHEGDKAGAWMPVSTPILGNKTLRANAILLMPNVLIIFTNEKLVFMLLFLRLSLMYPQLALNLSYS